MSISKNSNYNIQLFQNLNETFENEFIKYSKIIEYSEGSSPFYPDDLLKYFYIVIDGKIKSYQINFDNNKEQTIFIYRRGDMFDTISLLDNQPHEVIYEVLEDCKVAQIPIQRVRYWLDNDKTFNRKFYPYIASQMRHTEELATDLSLFDTSSRLIKLLLQNLDKDNIHKYNLLQNLSNSEIASLLGTVRHIIERNIKALKADGILETGRKKIKVLNLQKLLEKTTKMLLK